MSPVVMSTHANCEMRARTMRLMESPVEQFGLLHELQAKDDSITPKAKTECTAASHPSFKKISATWRSR